MTPDQASPGRRAALHAATAVVIVAMAYVMLARPVRDLRISRRAAIGSQVLSSADSAQSVSGANTPLLARDSLTILVFLNATCGQCGNGVLQSAELRRWASLQGVAVRLLAPGPEAGRTLRRTAADSSAILVVDPALPGRLGMINTPSTLWFDSNGFVRGRLIGSVPIQFNILNVRTALELEATPAASTPSAAH